ncbi:MAG: hypothetical protein QG610_1057 [Euryarchaeota archaeon]|nr:hypothetical protein [Euryarchaeota archaeon]
MSGGNRTGPLGQGSKTGRCLEYCTGNNAPGYTKRSSAGAGRKYGNKVGCRQRMDGRTGHNFRSKRAFGLESSDESGGSIYHGYYPATYQEQAESESEFFERRINSLKQELETLYRKLKIRRLPESSGQK